MSYDQGNRNARPRHAAHARGEQGFEPGVTGYSHPSSDYRPSRPMVGEDPLASETPRPIGVDPAETGSFRKLSSGEGAVLTSRDNAEQAAASARRSLRHKERRGSLRLQGRHRPDVEREPRHAPAMSRNLLIGIVVAAVVVIVVVGFLFSKAASSAIQAADDAQHPEQAQQEQVDTSESISYNGQTYGLVQEGGSWVLAQLGSDGSPQAALVTLDGAPVALVHYNSAFIIPENLDGSWVVMSYVPADGSVPSPVVDSDGNAVQGEGQIASAKLDGSSLDLQTDGGAVSVNLD